MPRTIGVLGGMGPEATARFYQLLVEKTPAACDQEHIPTIIFSEPRIPDRTEYLVRGHESPLGLLVQTAQRIESAGAELIAIPCNTAHFFWKEMQEAVSVPVLHIVRETVGAIRAFQEFGAQNGVKRTAAGAEVAPDGRTPSPPEGRCPSPRDNCSRSPSPPGLLLTGRGPSPIVTGRGPSPIGLLATTGTIRMGIYEPILREQGFEPIRLPDDAQAELHRIITQIKGRKNWEKLAEQLEGFIGELAGYGARDGVILGCTELGLLADEVHSPLPVFDSLEILAEAAVREAMRD